MTTTHGQDRYLAALPRDSGASASLVAASPSWLTGPLLHSPGIRTGHQSRPDPEAVGPDLAEMLTRLQHIRTELCALRNYAHPPIADTIVHDLDEAIQLAHLPACPVDDQRRPPPPEPHGAAQTAVRLPSGPDYPAPTYRSRTRADTPRRAPSAAWPPPPW